MLTKIADEGEHHNFSNFSSGRGPSTATPGKMDECGFERNIPSPKNRGVKQ